MSALLELQSVSRLFPVGPRGRQRLHAVDGVDISIAAGESIGLVGESGCGKSTLSRLVARLIDASGGKLRFDGQDVGGVPAKRFMSHPLRGEIQMVFQDASDSLNPRHTAYESIAEPLRLLKGLRDEAPLRARVEEVATQVGLPLALLARYPHQLSGGQKARVGIARAIAPGPKLLILDEPTAALDVSVQAVVLNLLADLREQLGMSYLFVSHDLNVVRLLCDRVFVMYLGKVVESGPVAEVFASPLHPYTQALVSAIPGTVPADKATRAGGEPMSPIDPDPRTCRFYGRCARSGGRCNTEMPLLRPLLDGREAACHHPLNADLPVRIPSSHDA